LVLPFPDMSWQGVYYQLQSSYIRIDRTEVNSLEELGNDMTKTYPGIVLKKFHKFWSPDNKLVWAVSIDDIKTMSICVDYPKKKKELEELTESAFDVKNTYNKVLKQMDEYQKNILNWKNEKCSLDSQITTMKDTMPASETDNRLNNVVKLWGQCHQDRLESEKIQDKLRNEIQKEMSELKNEITFLKTAILGAYQKYSPLATRRFMDKFSNIIVLEHSNSVCSQLNQELSQNGYPILNRCLKHFENCPLMTEIGIKCGGDKKAKEMLTALNTTLNENWIHNNNIQEIVVHPDMPARNRLHSILENLLKELHDAYKNDPELQNLQTVLMLPENIYSADFYKQFYCYPKNEPKNN